MHAAGEIMGLKRIPTAQLDELRASLFLRKTLIFILHTKFDKLKWVFGAVKLGLTYGRKKW